MPATMPPVNNAGGMCSMMAPNVCKVPAPPAPPIPTPLGSIGNPATAMPVTTKVMGENRPFVTVDSKTPMSNGDEPGVAGGVVSGKNLGEVVFKQGSSKVLVEGKQLAFLTAVTAHNGTNANTAGNVAMSAVMKIMVSP